MTQEVEEHITQIYILNQWEFKGGRMQFLLQRSNGNLLIEIKDDGTIEAKIKNSS